jgi:hypothetical protein
MRYHHEGHHQGECEDFSTNDAYAIDFDIAGGTPSGDNDIRAVASGTVAWADWYSSGSWRCFGNSVAINHDGNGTDYTSFYAHLASIANGISPGVHVEQGTVLGTAGNTGGGTDPVCPNPYSVHLHFALYKDADANVSSSNPPYGGKAVVPKPFSGDRDYEDIASGQCLTNSGSSPPPSCPPENCTPGNEVGRDFFVEVLERLADVPVSDFAVDALILWEPYEDTGACWNPLATTWIMEFRCDYNWKYVQSYQSQDMGTRATAKTLAQGYYYNIRRMLRLEEFNREGLRADLDVWGTCSGQTCSSLLDEWEALWIAHGGETALVKQCSDLTHDPENPEVGEQVTFEFRVCNYGEQAITLQDIGPQGFAPNGGLWNEFAHNVTVNKEDTATVSVSRSFAWEGIWTVDKIVYRDQADGSWHDLPANGYIQSHTFQVSSTPPPPADVPTPTSPANGSHFPSDTTSVIFTWSATTGPYEVELWWDGGSQMSGWLDDPTWTATGLSPRTYYWHVRATGPTNWSEDYQFTIDSPGAPWATPVSPANDSYFQYGTTSVTLTATGSGGPYQFEIWWASGSSLSGWLDNPTWVVNGLSPGVYYWHVMATGMTNWSQDFHFTIHSPGATPVSPPNGSYFQYGTTSVTLTASGSGGPYQFEIWWGGGSRISGWLDDPTWTVDGLSSNTYYWHVMATGMADWSQDFHFTIHSAGAHPTSPPDGHQFPNGTSQVTLEAEGSGGPYKFEIWWNGGSEISGWVDDPRWTTSTHGPGDYHWHVMAWGMSNWSVDWHFTVLRPPDNDPPIGSVLINATEMPPWTVEYTADALPRFSDPPWQRAAGWQGYEWAEYGILRSGTYSTDSYNYYRQAADLSNETGTTLEARLKVVSGQPLTTRAIGNNISIFDDARKIRLAIFPDGIRLGDCDVCDEYEMDTTDDFHVYRLTLLGDTAKAYVDGVVRLSGAAVTNLAWTEIWFGNDWMGAPDEGFWDYVRYYTGGAIPPSAEFTNNPDVTLTLSASDIGWGLSQMNIGIYDSATESYHYLGWENYSESKTITLSSGDGVKCVVVQYRDQADNLSDWYYNCIVLDTILPESTVNPLSATRSTLWFPVTWWGTDATSGIKSFDVQYKEGASGVWTDWITDTTTMSATFGGQNRRTYYFRSRGTDSAGNVEAYPGGEGDAHTCILLGDLDSSGRVDIVDIMMVASHWNTSVGDPNYDPTRDLDSDSDIDIVDIMMVAVHWGETCW